MANEERAGWRNFERATTGEWRLHVGNDFVSVRQASRLDERIVVEIDCAMADGKRRLLELRMTTDQWMAMCALPVVPGTEPAPPAGCTADEAGAIVMAAREAREAADRVGKLAEAVLRRFDGSTQVAEAPACVSPDGSDDLDDEEVERILSCPRDEWCGDQRTIDLAIEVKRRREAARMRNDRVADVKREVADEIESIVGVMHEAWSRDTPQAICGSFLVALPALDALAKRLRGGQ